MITQPVLKQRIIKPAALGLDGVVIANATTVTSNAFGLNGFSKLAWTGFIDRSAATAIVVYLDISLEEEYSSSILWYPYRSIATVAGVGTLSEFYWTVTGIGADIYISAPPIDICAMQGRIRVVSTNGNTDTLEMNVILA